MDAMWQALFELLSLHQLVYLMGGIALGLIVGILPGMGGTAGLALLLPFVYGMDQTSALALMIGLLASTAAGDAFASILMGIPGGSSAATILDGFPLTRQGHAARALSAAFMSSLLGGLFGAVVLTASIFVARPLILGVGMGEQLLLVLLALTMVGSLAGSSPLKGLAAAGLGLMIGTIGSAPATGELRYTFDTVYLTDGLPLVVVALGIFGVPEIIDLMRQKSAISQTPVLGSGRLQGIKDTFANWWLVLRVSVIGTFIGILPGVGGATADWVAYGHAVQTSKDSSQYGKGDIRGVIAPEGTNNATRGGDLIPTLFFGIPGSGSMALLLGAFVLIGIQPGPSMVDQHLNLVFVIVWSLTIGNILGSVICLALAGPIARITLIRYAFIAPIILMFIAFTAFQATKSWGDLVSLLALSFFAVLMKRFDWSRPALIVGFVLSGGLESSLYQVAQVYGFSFLARPQAIVIAVMVVASLCAGIYMLTRKTHFDYGEQETPPSTRLPQMAFTAVAAAIVGYAIWDSLDASYLTRIYPVWVGILVLALLVGVLIQQALVNIAHPALADLEAGEGTGVRASTYFIWFAGYFGLIGLAGFLVASFAFIFSFISFECGRPIWRNLAIAACSVGVMGTLGYYLYMEYPGSVFGEAFAFFERQ